MPKKISQHKTLTKEHLLLPGAFQMTYPFPFSEQLVWNALTDGETWTKWLPITEVIWTSPKPFGEGTTRTVKIENDTLEEIFIGWEKNKELTFFFNRSSLPIRGFIESYTLTPTQNGCELTWSVYIEANPIILPLLKFMMKRNGKKGFPKLSSYIGDNRDKFL